jgi:hypothetical protein
MTEAAEAQTPSEQEWAQTGIVWSPPPGTRSSGTDIERLNPHTLKIGILE